MDGAATCMHVQASIALEKKRNMLRSGPARDCAFLLLGQELLFIAPRFRRGEDPYREPYYTVGRPGQNVPKLTSRQADKAARDLVRIASPLHIMDNLGGARHQPYHHTGIGSTSSARPIRPLPFCLGREEKARLFQRIGADHHPRSRQGNNKGWPSIQSSHTPRTQYACTQQL